MANRTKQREVGTFNITVKGRNVLVTDAMQTFAIDKVEKIEKFSSRIIDVIITMDIQKLEHRVSIVMDVDHIKIKSQAASNDMYASIEKAVHKLENQLLKYKKRIQDHQAKSVSAIDMTVNVLNPSDYLTEINDEIEEENQRRIMEQLKPHEIVAQETLPLKVLTTEEAMMKMELSSDSFLIYRCEEDQKLKVIYRRKDNNYGIIQPES